MKKNVLSEFYEDGKAFIKVATKYGTCASKAEVLPENEDLANMWDGLSLVSYKNTYKAKFAKAKYLHQRWQGMRIAYDNLAQSVPRDNEVMVKLARQVKIAEKAYKDLKKEAINMEHNYSNFAKQILTLRKHGREQIDEYLARKEEINGEKEMAD